MPLAISGNTAGHMLFYLFYVLFSPHDMLKGDIWHQLFSGKSKNNNQPCNDSMPQFVSGQCTAAGGNFSFLTQHGNWVVSFFQMTTICQ